MDIFPIAISRSHTRANSLQNKKPAGKTPQRFLPLKILRTGLYIPIYITDTRKKCTLISFLSARVVEDDVLPGELQQHGVVEELVDGDVLREALAPPGLHHELAGEGSGGLEGKEIFK